MNNKFSSFAKHAGVLSVGIVAGILVSLQFSAIAQKEGETNKAANLPYDEIRQFVDVFGAIKANYVENVEDKKLTTEAISGMLSGLDPHSSYLDADAYKELQVGTQGEFGGLGIEVGMEDGYVKVVSPIEDTPAAKAGLKSGDLIIKIDGSSTKGMNLGDAVKKMRGKPKTNIVLTIARKGMEQPFDVTLVRDIIKVQSIKYKALEDGYAYIRITQFQEHTTENLVQAIEKLNKEGALKQGLVLDLRNDPGGLLHGAVGVSATFLPSKTLVVSTDGRNEDSKKEYFAAPEDYLRGTKDDYLKSLPASIKNIKMVVLVNGGSASASEIVAGALQDHKRAVVMGSQTFGKGSVQTIIPLSNTTAIKLTTARYYTPNKRSIQAKGITPDIKVDETAEGNLSSGRLREADLEKHLINDKDPEAEAKKNALKDTSKEAEKKQKIKAKDDKEEVAKKPIELGSKEDFQLQQALNHLKGLPVKISQSNDKEDKATDVKKP